MDFQVKGRNLEVSESIRSYAAAKLGKLERHLRDPLRVELELSLERNPSISANHVAEATVWTKGPVLRAHEASGDMKASIDQLVTKLERQIKRYSDRRRRRPSRRDGAAAEALQGDEPMIVKTKQFAVKPMSADEAVLQLELIGHDFFVFRNADTGGVNVVYRRHGGGYGLIEPQ